MTVAIIQYNAGNTCSVRFALERLGVHTLITDDILAIQSADKVIFPGVGEASTAMEYLRNRGLDRIVKDLKQPVLGICLGMQLLCRHSEENDTDCLGIFNTEVRLFSFDTIVPGGGSRLKVPQVGWNKITDGRLPLFTLAESAPYFYFVHSYYAEICAQTAGVAEYGIPFSAALQKDNFYGVQFHPEKSAESGEQLLINFLNV